VITGGARGIGRACAEAFLREGAKVVIADRDFDQAHKTAVELGPQAVAIAVDVTEGAQIRNMADETIRLLGRIDFLVNSAGTAHQTPSLDLSEELWDSILGLNLKGTFFCCQTCAPHIAKNKGAIVNISSFLAGVGLPQRAACSASKGGITSLTKVLAVEWAELGIRVNAVAPGFTYTEISEKAIASGRLDPKWVEDRSPMHRWGKPEEIAEAVLFLAGDKASFINGETIYVDGGWTSSAG
jgi:NAD(P)-dependent dehydrogenase (short-subunit alcohol dehydrogenase family)